jgi:hypothetical protein
LPPPAPPPAPARRNEFDEPGNSAPDPAGGVLDGLPGSPPTSQAAAHCRAALVDPTRRARSRVPTKSSSRRSVSGWRTREDTRSWQRPAPKETKCSESLHIAAGNTCRYHNWATLVIESVYVAVTLQE